MFDLIIDIIIWPYCSVFLDLLISQSSDHFLLKFCISVENDAKVFNVVYFLQCLLKYLTRTLKLSPSCKVLTELYPKSTLIIRIFRYALSYQFLTINSFNFVRVLSDNLHNIKLKIFFGLTSFRVISIVF